MTKANNISSDYRANSFCCVLNNVDKLFDKKSDFFDNDKYKPKTKKRIQEFRKLLPNTDMPLSPDRKSTRLNSSHQPQSRMPSSA